ncbi:hypothetical protein A2841_02345 [Candidatus Kaiserbacteria bacterium RIFCSPHIGHO2_01_FULL_48_10]|uniref:Nudix hydrolase domain-containing protein n=1 Tax=Candidatus Kaiserbacteria bacterium RIFCSPHIGHO2_01_FULL_48_10 TaxID=1798476 RepID=A0A1F6C6T3_9BACT|nr:MAG: hypothetical protein A2841_02345 [Candidatus Kaiserbacteria bacterium RIFCSPHIGHO2_01_FULL_48_10]HLC99637.1 NUDIX domain-containing protein [Patescibacteria group bacterium]
MKAGIDYIGVSTPFYCNDGNGRFLLHKRGKNCRDEHGKWDPGAGQLEFGLTPEENVLREVMEEYGCKGEIQEAVQPHSIFREWNGQKTHWFAIPFFVKVDPKEARINEPHKMDEIGWFTLDQLPKPLHTAFLYTLKHYRKYFEKHR